MRVMVLFGRGARDGADGREQAAVIEPVRLFEHRVSCSLGRLPQSRRWMISALRRPSIVASAALS
jgi:hypothetical protein